MAGYAFLGLLTLAVTFVFIFLGVTAWIPRGLATLTINGVWGFILSCCLQIACCLTLSFVSSALIVLSRAPKEGRLCVSGLWILAGGVSVLLSGYLGWLVFQAVNNNWHGWPLTDLSFRGWIYWLPVGSIPVAWCLTWALDVARRQRVTEHTAGPTCI